MGRRGYSIHQRFFTSAFTVPRRHRKNDRISSCSIISSCCRFSLRKTKEETTKKKKKVDENRFDQPRDGEIAESMNGGVDSSSSLKCSVISGEGRDVCFNLGVGFGIIHVIAASKYELNKMVELSKQMETLVYDLKKRSSQNTQITSDAATTTNRIEAQDGQGRQSHPLQTQNPVAEIQNSYPTNRSDINMKAKSKKKMDQLEAELEVELENLQVQLNSETVANCEYTTTEISIEDSAPEESFGEQSFQIEESELEVMMINDIENNYNNGVSPVDLERRLHELLAMRQEEKIKALESALDSAIQKLHENQKELSWWKGTARLVFQKIAPNY